MNWLDRLERKWGRFAIKRLMYYIISLNFVVFLLMMVNRGDIIGLLILDPSLVMRGEVWRLVSFSPSSLRPLRRFSYCLCCTFII